MNRWTSTATESGRGVDVAGPPEAQSIVLAHGAMFTRKMWGPQRDALAEEFRVVAPDLPGHGDRSGESFDLERGIAVLDDAIESYAGGSAVLVGLSLGGYLVTEYASRYPRKVDGLVVVGSSANPIRGLNLATRLTGAVVRLATRSDLVERAAQRLGKRWVRNRDLSPEHEREILESGIFPREFGTPGPDIAGRNARPGHRRAERPGETGVVPGTGARGQRRARRAHAPRRTGARGGLGWGRGRPAGRRPHL
ncbi:Pimeloyl-ACP methyl ester carboxylesterase [Halobiforma haloterrestris]|uniref:Pimeloyl-ACP methyl ester carboxylesterase n=1 Tax=Natronobacterium haloterrestre TaxID=148448 RepID=A0A1I1EGM6_NATHA|nr:Pimeloyl-ACP methyl ester carboxylesterase [Halobiforma haloterrestris]